MQVTGWDRHRQLEKAYICLMPVSYILLQQRFQPDALGLERSIKLLLGASHISLGKEYHW